MSTTRSSGDEWQASRVRATAAATVANLGPGFDVLGLCLGGPRDSVTAVATDTGEVELVAVRGDGGKLPTLASDNCAGVAAKEVLTTFGPSGMGVRLWLDKGLPLGSGLGSSAASSVAAAVAVAALIEERTGTAIDRAELLDACREGERLATGSPHPDNVAPSLLGGVVACLPRDEGEIEVVRLPIGAAPWVACVKPDVAIATRDARAVLPAEVPLSDAVANVGAVAGLVAGLASGDLALFGRCLADRLVTPYRKALIPGFDEALAAAVAAGAVGGGISGSGPTCFAVAADEATAQVVATAMQAAFETAGHDAIAVVSAVDPVGAVVTRTSD